MTKKEIIDSVSLTTGIQKRDVYAVFQTILNVMSNSLVTGSNIYIRGFGTFKVVESAPKKAMDIHRKKSVVIPSRKVVKFKVSDYISDKLNKNIIK